MSKFEVDFSLFSSHYNVWFSCDIVGRNKMFLTLRGPGFKPVTFMIKMLENFSGTVCMKMNDLFSSFTPGSDL